MRAIERQLAPSAAFPRRYLEIARESLECAERMLAAAPARLGRARPALVELGEVLSAACADVTGEIRLAEARLRLRAAPALVRADRDGLRSAFRNLIRNAAVHGLVPGRPLHVQIRVQPGRSRHVVSISDDGRGLRDAALKTLGQRAAPLERPGRGLGLPIARAAIEASGGSIELCRREGEGTTIRVVLPAARGDGGSPR